MGKQFSFFLAPDDIPEFECALRLNGDTAFIQSRPIAPQAVEMPSLDIQGFRTLLCQPESMDGIRFLPIRNQEYFKADSLTEDIVECDTPVGIHNGFLIEGRLYCQTSYWNSNREKVQKRLDFLRWVDRLFRRTKKSLTFVDKWFYAGEHALRLRSEGIKFNQLDGWAGR